MILFHIVITWILFMLSSFDWIYVNDCNKNDIYYHIDFIFIVSVYTEMDTQCIANIIASKCFHGVVK